MSLSELAARAARLKEEERQLKRRICIAQRSQERHEQRSRQYGCTSALLRGAVAVANLTTLDKGVLFLCMRGGSRLPGSQHDWRELLLKEIRASGLHLGAHLDFSRHQPSIRSDNVPCGLKLNIEPFFRFDPRTRQEVWPRRHRRCIIAFNVLQATPSVMIRPRRAQRGNLLHVCASPGVLAFESSTRTTTRPPTSGPSWRGPRSLYIQHARVPLLYLLGWI
jgi:hypothetical protein